MSRVVVWVVFALLYAYPLFEGISNLIALPAVLRRERDRRLPCRGGC